MVKNGTHLSEQKQKAYGKYFDIEIFPRTRKIKSYKRNNKAIDAAIELEGFHVLASSVEMTCSEALDVKRRFFFTADDSSALFSFS